jgi:Transglutaminase-like superfamily
MTRRALAGVILLAWGGALGWLGLRQSSPPADDALSDALRTVPPGATYYTVALGEAAIGFASNTVDTVPDGITVDDRLMLEIPALGTINRTDLRTVAKLTNRLRLRHFEATLGSAAGSFLARGDVSGDTLLTVELVSEGNRQQIRVPLTKPIVLPAYAPLRLAFGGNLEVGKTYSLETFDPLMLQERTVSFEILAESTLVVPDSAIFDSILGQWSPARWDTVHAWQVNQETQGISVTAWIDDLGRIVSARSVMGFALQRSPFEMAFYNFRRRDRAQTQALLGNSDIVRQTAIASNVILDREQPTTLRVRLGGVDLRGFDLDGGRQTLRGDTLEVRRETDRQIVASYRLPDGANTGAMAAFIRPEPLIQSDDPRIQARARQIIAGTHNPQRAAERLNTWVHDNLQKEITVSIPSAVQVLTTERGDCNEHTILYVALARAVGLPARTAAGLVYSGRHFYYHAWPEVYLGQEWVAVDPTFGQFPADASHLRFTIGGLARQAELIRLIGRLSLDVLSTEE